MYVSMSRRRKNKYKTRKPVNIFETHVWYNIWFFLWNPSIANCSKGKMQRGKKDIVSKDNKGYTGWKLLRLNWTEILVPKIKRWYYVNIYSSYPEMISCVFYLLVFFYCDVGWVHTLLKPTQSLEWGVATFEVWVI